MAATIRPTLTVYSYSPANAASALITSATLSPINTVNSAVHVSAQHLNLPQRAEWFQTVYDSVGANYQWEVSEAVLITKPRGLR